MTVSLTADAAFDRETERDYGLENDVQRLVNAALHNYSHRLSLRRIPERDPAYRPPRVFGVYEEGVLGGISPWVFTLAPEHVDERVLARVIAGDMSKSSHKERMAALQKANQLMQAEKEAQWAAEHARRRDEMLFILGTKRSSIRHKLGDDTLILSDETRSPRTHIS